MQKKNEVEHLNERIKELEIEVRKKELERIKLAGDLKKDEVMLRNILEHSTNFFYSHTTDHVLTYLSPQVYDILGYKPEEAKMKWMDLATDHPMNNEGYKKTVAAIETGKIQEPYELELIHKQGNKVYVKVHEAPVVEKGKTIAIVGSITDITDQKIAGSGLKESEKRYSTLFEQAADGILVGIGNGEIVEANLSMLKLTGYKKDEIIGKNIGVLFSKEELQAKPFRYDLVKKGDTIISERNIIRKDGTFLPIEMNTKVLEDGRMQALFRDISKRKIAENELIKSKNLLQKAEIIAGLGSYFYEVKADKWESSGVLNDIYGIDHNYTKNFKNWIEVIHPDFREEMLKYFTINILQNHEQFNKEYKILRKADKTERWVHGYGEIELDSENNPISVFGTIQDITERKLAELALKESEEKYRSLVENISEFVFVINKDYQIVSLNISAQKALGVGKVFVGKSIDEVFPNHISENYKISLREVLEKQKPINRDSTMELKGRKFYINTSLSPLKNDEGEITAVIGLTRDITGKKLAELALIEKEEKYRNIFHNSPLGILHYNMDGIITDCNNHFVNIIGSSKDVLIGLNMIKDLKNKNLVETIKKSLLKGESYYEDWYTSITANKKTFVRILFKGIRDSNRKIVSGIGLVEDITERKEIEQQIFNAVVETEEKERARLASDIHDEIGPLLSSLKMYIESISENNDKEKQIYLKNKLKDLIKESITNVREVSNSLSPYILREYGLVAAIESFLENSKDLIKVSYETNLKLERFPLNIETVYYRILKELFNNTIKHAEAQNISVKLNYTKKILELVYKDDGKGININQIKQLEKKGMGIFNITSRINSIKGMFEFGGNQSNGFEFKMFKEIETIKDI